MSRASTGPGTVGISSFTANFLDGFHERYPNGLLHYTSQTWFFDGQLSYDFTFLPPVENQPVAGYSKDAKDVTMGKDGKATESAVTQTATVALPLWKQVLNGTTITLGCNDMFGAGSSEGLWFRRQRDQLSWLPL